MIFEALGILSAVVFILGDIPYIVDTIKGKTKPQRVTWGVVTILNGIGFANQYASGADNSLWLFGVATAITLIIFLLSLKFGVGGHSKTDIFSIITAFVGLGLWYIFDSPLFSIFANIFVAIVALIPTFIKARREPETETKIAWLCGAIAALMATVSVGKIDWQLLILPAVSTMLQGYMVYLLYFRKRLKQE